MEIKYVCIKIEGLRNVFYIFNSRFRNNNFKIYLLLCENILVSLILFFKIISDIN